MVFQREKQRSSEKGGKSGKGLAGLNLNSHSHWNSSWYWRWQCRSRGRGFRITFSWHLHSSSSHLDVKPGYQKLNVLFGWLCSCVFPFLFPSFCQMSPPATPVMRCHMHGVGSVPEFTDFGTKRDLSVIEPDFLHSPGHPTPHHCVSVEPNPWSLAQLPQRAQCWVRTSQARCQFTLALHQLVAFLSHWEGCLEKDLKELCGSLESVNSSAVWGLSPLSPLNSGAAWSVGALYLELCWFVHYFVKIPKSGEAEEKRTRLLDVCLCALTNMGGFW